MQRHITPQDFLFKTQPYAHQRKAFELGRDRSAYGYLMEMGTGKTKVTIDDAAYSYREGRITCLLVIAPNGVHANWTKWDDDEPGEIQKHMPEWCKPVTATWASNMLAADRDACEALFDPKTEGLRVVAMNVEAFRDATKCKAAIFVRRLMTAFNVMMVVDESSWIKTPGAKRTKALITLGQQAVARRVLTGTPVTQGPLDVYAQFRFLGKNLLGFDNYYSFKNHFATWRQERTKTGQRYEVLIGYKNIGELQALVDKHAFRCTKAECLDLPQKVYTRRQVALSKEQRKLYDEVKRRAYVEVGDDEELPITNVLTRLVRLQQVLGGHLPEEEFGEAKPLPGSNPRVQTVLDILQETSGKVLVWARFRAEHHALEEAISKVYGKKAVVSYHGGVEKQDRQANINRFQNDPECRFFVGQQKAGGYGITLTAADTVVYYSNTFSLEDRLQSEDRAHRIGQKHNVTYIDIECPGTLDTKVLEALHAKKDLADLITRDSLRQLLRD